MDTQSLPLFRKEHRDKMLAVSLQYVYSVFSVDDCEIEIYMGLGGSKTCGIVPGLSTWRFYWHLDRDICSLDISSVAV